MEEFVARSGKDKNRRIVLDEEARGCLENMLNTISSDGEFVKIKSSGLVSWILVRYFSQSFEKDKPEIIKDHFNSKEYLKSLIKGIDSADDLPGVLQDTLDKINHGKRRRRQKV